MGCASSNREDAKDSQKAKSGGGGGGGGAGGKNGNANATGAGGEGEAAAAAPTPKQNPYISLTPKDVFSLKMSYKGIRRNMEDTGVAMFIKLVATTTKNGHLNNKFNMFFVFCS